LLGSSPVDERSGRALGLRPGSVHCLAFGLTDETVALPIPLQIVCELTNPFRPSQLRVELEHFCWAGAGKAISLQIVDSQHWSACCEFAPGRRTHDDALPAQAVIVFSVSPETASRPRCLSGPADVLLSPADHSEMHSSQEPSTTSLYS